MGAGIRNLPREANLAVALGDHTGSHGTVSVTAQRALLSLLSTSNKKQKFMSQT